MVLNKFNLKKKKIVVYILCFILEMKKCSFSFIINVTHTIFWNFKIYKILSNKVSVWTKIMQKISLKWFYPVSMIIVTLKICYCFSDSKRVDQ